MVDKGTILYFGCFEMPDRNASAHRVLNNGKILEILGYNVCFCGIDKHISEMAEKPFKISGNFLSWPKPYPKNSKEWFADLIDFEFYKKCINYFDDVKYIIFFDPHALPLKRLIKYCESKNIELVADVSEWYENHFGFTPGKFFRWLDTELVMKHYLKKVHNIIVISNLLKNYYTKYADKMIVVPPLIDISEDIWYQKLSSRPKMINFVYAGTTDRYKDKLDTIIDVFSSINDENFHLDIFGLTAEDFIRIYPEKADLLNVLNDKIAFNGFVSHDTCVCSLLNSQCTLIIRDSSRKNDAGFPTKFVEAATTGIKTIISNISDVKQYAVNNKNVIILDNNSVENIKKCVLAVISNGTDYNAALTDTFDYHSFVTLFKSMF